MAIRRGLFVAALAAWLAGFVVLRRHGSWMTFAVAGPALAALAVALDPAVRRLLRPSWRTIALGLVAGVAMAALTHAGFALTVGLWPALREPTAELYRLLNVGGFSPIERAALVALIASSEEVVFRGGVLTRAAEQWSRPGASRWGALGGVLVAATLYAAASATLGSWLLIACALACGVLWGALRVASRSVVAPTLAHLVWDVVVLLAWPLA